MIKTTRMRLGSPAWLAVALVILVPALAEAQLFPNRTIRREKPDCASEPPFYKQVRRDYFGYYPTCWSKFPAGWGCPCPDPELLAMRAALAKDKPRIDSKPSNAERDPFGPDDDMDRDTGPGPDRALPNDNRVLPPPSTSPFEMDSKPSIPNTPPPGRTSGIGPSGSSPSTPSANSAPSNLELPPLPSTSPTSSNEPAVRPGSIAMYPEDVTLASSTSNARPDLGPLPSAPMPAPYIPDTGSTTGTATSDVEMVLGTPLQASTSTSSPTITPAQAPKRKSFLSQLFGRNNTNTQKR
jgi:hypothetical protein